MQHRLLIIGDTHCRFDVLEQVVAGEAARAAGLVAVLHCGDLGVYDPGSPARLSARELELIEKHENPVELCYPYLSGERRLPLPLYGIPGNHEDFSLVAELEQGRRRLPGLRLLAPGEQLRLTLGGVEVAVLGLGRILPEGLSPRRRSEAKYISEEALALTRDAARRSRPDLLLLHEPPGLRTPATGRSFGSQPLLELVEEVGARVVLFGHMHLEMRARIGGSEVYGLGYGVAGRYGLLNEALEVELLGLDGQSIRPLEAVEARALPGPGAERAAQRAAKARKARSVLFQEGELLAHFKLGRLRKAERRRLGQVLGELRASLAEGPPPDRAELLAQAERLLVERGFLSPTEGSDR